MNNDSVAELRSDEDLTLTDAEADHLLELKQQILSKPEKSIRLLRRQLRYRIFRIREGREEFDLGLRKYLLQHLNGRRLSEFTFTWDLHPTDPLKIVEPIEWIAEGGKTEVVREPDQNGIVRNRSICDPTAFTNQEM